MEEAGYGAQASGSTAERRQPLQKSKLLKPLQHKTILQKCPSITHSMSYNMTITIVSSYTGQQ